MKYYLRKFQMVKSEQRKWKIKAISTSFQDFIFLNILACLDRNSCNQNIFSVYLSVPRSGIQNVLNSLLKTINQMNWGSERHHEENISKMLITLQIMAR